MDATDPANAPATLNGVAGPSALAVIPPGQTPAPSATAPLVHVGLGDLELRVSATDLAKLVLDPMADILRANPLVATMARSAALMGYGTIKKLMRAVKPDYPQPDMPRGADPAIYVCTYLLGVATAYLLEWHWTLDYRERQDGALHIIAARPASRMDANDHATDGTDDPLGPRVDTANAESTARTA